MMPGLAAFSRCIAGRSSATISIKLRPLVGEVSHSQHHVMRCDAGKSNCYNLSFIRLHILPFADSAPIPGLCRGPSSNDSLSCARIPVDDRHLIPHNLRQAFSAYLFLVAHGVLRSYKWECLVSGDVQNATHAQALAAVTTVDNSAQLGQDSERALCGGAVLKDWPWFDYEWITGSSCCRSQTRHEMRATKTFLFRLMGGFCPTRLGTVVLPGPCFEEQHKRLTSWIPRTRLTGARRRLWMVKPTTGLRAHINCGHLHGS